MRNAKSGEKALIGIYEDLEEDQSMSGFFQNCFVPSVFNNRLLDQRALGLLNMLRLLRLKHVMIDD